MNYSIDRDPSPEIAKRIRTPLNKCCATPYRIILHWPDPIDARFGLQDSVELLCRSCKVAIQFSGSRVFDAQYIADALTKRWNERIV